jgi:hypothetical protein
MRRLLISGLAALALAGAPTAQAEPYSAADLDFISSVAFWGYAGDTDDLIDKGRTACRNLDAGVSMEHVNNWVVYTLDSSKGTNTPESYFAAHFIQSAALAYCPWQTAATQGI